MMTDYTKLNHWINRSAEQECDLLRIQKMILDNHATKNPIDWKELCVRIYRITKKYKTCSPNKQ